MKIRTIALALTGVAVVAGPAFAGALHDRGWCGGVYRPDAGTNFGG